MSSGGGGGQDGTTRYEWNPDIGFQWRGNPESDDPNQNWGALSEARRLYSEDRGATPYTTNWQDRLATMDDSQAAALANLKNFGLNYSSPDAGGNYGSQQSKMARGAIGSMIQGGMPEWNAYADQGGKVGTRANAFQGMDNPYFKDTVKNAQEDVTSAYNTTTDANNRRMGALSGAFGGSAHQAAVANAQSGLAKQLGNMTSGMYDAQYNRSAGLDESAAGRELQAGQANQGSLANYWSQLNNNRSQGINQAFGADDAYYKAMGSLAGVGDSARQYNQQILDAKYGIWNDNNNLPWQNLGRFSNLISQAQGGVNPSAFQGGGYSPSISPMAGLLGAGALYGAFK